MTRYKSLLLAIAATTTLTLWADALDPASRAVLRRETLLERQAAASIADRGAGSLRALARTAQSPAATQPIMALIELKEGASAADLAGEGVELLGERHGFAFATMTPTAAERLSAHPAIRKMELNRRRDLKMNLVREATGVDRVHQGIDLPQAYTGKGVVCGVVDGGFDPNHPNFLNPDGTSRFGYFAQVTINNMGTSVNISQYDPAQLDRFTTDDRSTYHGTHTTGIMAGSYRGTAKVAEFTNFPKTHNVDMDCPYYGVACDAEIAASTGMGYDALIAYALDGILQWRWDERHYHPIVINMSVGGNQGPHDGSSTICRFMDICAEQDGAVFCLSAGNEGDIPLAISKTFTADDLSLQTGILPVIYGPDYGNIRYGIVELYGDDDTPFDMQAVIYNKSRGRVICRMPLSGKNDGQIQYWCSGSDYQASSEDIIDTNFARAFKGYVGVVSTFDANTGRYYAVLDLYTMDNPTTNADGNYVLGIEINGKEGQRLNGYTDGGLIAFSSLGIDGWAEGSTDGTISDIACGQNTICVGSWDIRNNYPAMNGGSYNYPFIDIDNYTYYSSYANLPDGRSLPHLCAPGATVISSVSTPFVSTADNQMSPEVLQARVDGAKRNSYYMQSQGTSMATPVVSGTVALMLEANPDLTFDEVRDILMATAVRDEYYDALPDKAQAGAGKLDSYAAVKMAVDLSGVSAIKADQASRKPIVKGSGTRSLTVGAPGRNGFEATLFDLAGRRAIATSAPSGDEITIDCSAIQPGVYVLRVEGYDATRVIVK